MMMTTRVNDADNNDYDDDDDDNDDDDRDLECMLPLQRSDINCTDPPNISSGAVTDQRKHDKNLRFQVSLKKLLFAGFLKEYFFQVCWRNTWGSCLSPSSPVASTRSLPPIQINHDDYGEYDDDGADYDDNSDENGDDNDYYDDNDDDYDDDDDDSDDDANENDDDDNDENDYNDDEYDNNNDDKGSVLFTNNPHDYHQNHHNIIVVIIITVIRCLLTLSECSFPTIQTGMLSWSSLY